MADGGLPIDRDQILLQKHFKVQFGRVAPLRATTEETTPAILHGSWASLAKAVVNAQAQMAHTHGLLQLTVRETVRDQRVRGLEERVSKLERALEKFTLWRVNDVKSRIKELAERHEVATADRAALDALVDSLHSIARAEGWHCLPAPQVDWNPEATLNIVWFDQRNHSSVAVTVLQEDQSEEGRVWLHGLHSGSAFNLFDPSKQQITEALRQFLRS